MVDAESLRVAGWPDLDAPVGEELEGEGSGDLGEFFLEGEGRASRVEVDIDANEGSFGGGGDVVGEGFELGFFVGGGFELFGLLAEVFADCDGKLFSPNLLGGCLFLVNVLGVDARFDGFEPGVVDPLGDFILV